MTTGSRAIPGHLLSCYTSSVASYLAVLGLDPHVPLGSQWFVGVNGDARDPATVEVRHHHTPLLGDGSRYRVDLRARRSASCREAHELIVAEVKRTGAAIAIVDTERLPWLVTYGKASAPHWIVVNDVDVHGALHVVDLFEWIDETGEQRAHDGWVAAAELECFAYPPALERDPRYRSRERLAFGEPLAPPPAPADDAPTWRWFECVGRTDGEASEQQLADRLWARSCGAAERERIAGELADGDAIGRLTDVLDASLDSPAAYALRNDMWVIGRTRELFLEQLVATPPTWLDEGAARSLASGLGAEVVWLWQTISRQLYYSSVMVGYGKPARRTVVEVLREVVLREEAFRHALREHASSITPA
jgi:hypothetical protein